MKFYAKIKYGAHTKLKFAMKWQKQCTLETKDDQSCLKSAFMQFQKNRKQSYYEQLPKKASFHFFKIFFETASDKL